MILKIHSYRRAIVSHPLSRVCAWVLILFLLVAAADSNRLENRHLISSFVELACQVLEEDGTQVLVDDVKSEPVAKVPVVADFLAFTSRYCALAHASNVKDAQGVEEQHGEEVDQVDDGEKQNENVPEVEEDENLLVDDVEWHVAERVVKHDRTRVAKGVNTALGLQREDDCGELAELCQISLHDCLYCRIVLDPEVIDDVLHKEHVPDDGDDAQELANEVLDDVEAMVLAVNALHIGVDMLALLLPLVVQNRRV